LDFYQLAIICKATAKVFGQRQLFSKKIRSLAEEYFFKMPKMHKRFRFVLNRSKAQN
jgi:hypothetical protein